MTDEILELYMDAVLKQVEKKCISYDQAAQELSRSQHFTPAVLDQAVRALEAMAKKTINSGNVPAFDDGERKPWHVPNIGKRRYWPRLEGILLDKGWGDATVAKIDDASEQVFGRLSAPWGQEFADRGLVLGYVQSGKTANFTAVMAKAADSGFRLIIVLAGIHNSLRSQTQKRLQAEVAHAPDWHMLTDANRDFEKPSSNAASYFGDRSTQPVLCVIKKEKSRLTKLIQWLEAGLATTPGCLSGTPALIIDDEADQAGINTGTDNDPTTINRLIVNLLSLLPRHSYLAYTATPYANVLTDPTSEQSLYPRNFIVSLPRPAVYFGVERLFGNVPLTEDDEDDSLSMLRAVPVDESRRMQPRGRQVQAFEAEVVPSLASALEWFLLAVGVRLARGQSKSHMTMLIHSTLYADAHFRIASVVEDFIKALERQLEHDPVATRKRLKARWDEENAELPVGSLGEEPVGFSQVWPELADALAVAKVIVDNGRSDERLAYAKGIGSIQIVVGGNTLSRGLTLEGLTVSYFVRASSTYDTLMQMGRWFGYRNGYADLPRIWMTAELADNFAHLATVEREIREDIDRYEELGLTPLQLGVRIRTHSTLSVTNPMKMKSATTAKATFGGATKQTTWFQIQDQAWLDNNREAATKLLRACGGTDAAELVWNKHRLWRGVSHSHVQSFLSAYTIHDKHGDMAAMAVDDQGHHQRTLIEQYIVNQVEMGRLTSWNIAVVGQTKPPRTWSEVLPGAELPLLVRARLKHKPGPSADIGALLTQEDRAIDFGEPKSPARRKGLVRWAKSRRDEMGVPLLLLYPIDATSQPRNKKEGSARMALDALDHVIGLAMLFPDSEGGVVKYVTVALDEQVETPEPEEI